MTTFLLIRHGLTDTVGNRITGQLPGVHLSDIGRRQVRNLPERLKRYRVDAVYSSPLERAVETAGPLAASLDLPIHTSNALNEINFGDWSGKTLAELDQCYTWNIFNRARSLIRPPGGELLFEVQARFIAEIEQLGEHYANKTVALFSHADPIKAALMFYLGMPLDLLQRLEISPASVSEVHLFDWGAEVWGINERAA